MNRRLVSRLPSSDIAVDLRTRRTICGDPGKKRAADVAAPFTTGRARLANVEDRSVRVDAVGRRLDGVVRLVALRGGNALEDARRGSRPVTTDRQDALRAVRERDRDDGGAVGPRALVDVVREGPAGLGTRGGPAGERGGGIGRAPAARG